ncbi:MAG: hypothetical protein IKY82_04030 [Alistipes sp.]|nr:hypothetical protein [Alistipes sp.]
MKKSIYLSLIALMFSVASFAQQNESNDQPKERKAPTVEEVAKRKADRMRQELLLGNDQYDKVYKLCLKQTKKEFERREQMKAEKEAFNKDMKGILNEAQYERYEKQQAPRPNFGKFNVQSHRNRNNGPQQPQFQRPPFQQGGQMPFPKQEFNRNRKMFDDMPKPEEAQKPIAMNDASVLTPAIIASVEADLLA